MISTLHTIDTIYSADSVEWCPHEHSQEFFVCGTYQLENPSEQEKKSQFSTTCKRKGRIYLYRFNITDESLHEEFQMETNAILDQKWHPRENVLATADSKGIVTLFKLDDPVLESIAIRTLQDDDILALSLDWNNDGTKLLVSDSKGGFSIVQVDNSYLQLLHHQSSAHAFEAWTCAWDRHNPDLLFTGGDDTFLNCYDMRLDPSCPALKWKNKSHGAGVTSLLSCSHIEHSLITGSYDESLRYFDTRQPKSNIFDLSLGGGIWRIKQHPTCVTDLLTANMYHNFTVVELSTDQFLLKESYFEHKSICYGADWYPSEVGNTKYFATCSFYDHKLCVAKYNK